MQNELSVRIEKLWSMAKIARAHGQLSFESVAGKVCEKIDLCGLRFIFENGRLIRVRGQGLDVLLPSAFLATNRNGQSAALPHSGSVHFLQGDDESLNMWSGQIVPFGEVFSNLRRAA